MKMAGSSMNRNSISMANKCDRVILLIDMDCFYCQVEEKLNPSLKGQPLAVVQYNEWRGGGIIAVNYAARAKGVTRHMRGDEAKAHCPDIQLVRVPNLREKADLSKYRDAGKEVANVLQRFTNLLERASVDEAYLDISETVNKRLEQVDQGVSIIQPDKLISTYAVGFPNIGDYITAITTKYSQSLTQREGDDLSVQTSDIRLLIGASIANEIRMSVKAETGYECSAGIAHNKILAKLACGMNKPNKQTVLPLQSISQLFATLPLHKIKGLGGKFGEEICQRLSIRYAGQLANYTEVELCKLFDEKNAMWLYNISRGIDLEAVTPRFYSKSIGCCKKFPGRNNITGIKTLQHWLNELANEINHRLQKDIIENNRRAKQMVVSFVQCFDGQEVSSSRSAPLNSYDVEQLATASLEILKANTKQFFRPGSDCVLNNPIRFLGISVGKFETNSNAQSKLLQMFAHQAGKKQTSHSGNKQKSETKIHHSENVNEQSTISNNGPNASTMQVEVSDNINVNNMTNENQSCSNFNLSKCHNVNSMMERVESSDELKSLIDDINDLQKAENSNLCNVPESINNAHSESKSSSLPAQHGAIKRKLDNVENVPPDVKQNDYRLTYVECAIPTNMNLIDMITCPKCAKAILNDELAIQTHRDYHFAQELSAEQRREYREERKISSTSTKANLQTAAGTKENKKPKRNQSHKSNRKASTTSSTSSTITKFLKQKNATSSATEDVNLTTALISSSDKVICDVCKLPVGINELTEHKDYHIARDMQKQFYQMEIQKMNTKKTIPSPKRNTGVKTITQFFTNAKS